MIKTYFTSESVTEGNPDKVCDQIADAILDEYLKQDLDSQVNCEVTAAMDQIHLMGEISSREKVDHEKVIKQILRNIGYGDPESGLDIRKCGIKVDIQNKSPNINKSARKIESLVKGAGDQGMMFGFACKETTDYMPLAIELAHKLAKRLAQVRKMLIVPGLLPDGKTQVTVEYHDGIPARVDAIIISARQIKEMDADNIRSAIIEKVIYRVIPQQLIDSKTKIKVNLEENALSDIPLGHYGVTGHRIISDTYGGYARHGGGSFSGKDPSSMNRSGAYMARYLAKNIVASGYADKCEVQLSYASGIAEPISIYVDTFGTSSSSEKYLLSLIKDREDLTTEGIIRTFDLKRPIYSQISCYGHFGENASHMPWEKIEW